MKHEFSIKSIVRGTRFNGPRLTGVRWHRLMICLLVFSWTNPAQTPTENIQPQNSAVMQPRRGGPDIDSQPAQPPDKGVTKPINVAPGSYHERVVVLEAYNLQYKNEGSEYPYRRKAALNDIIELRVENLKELLDQSRCEGENLPTPCRKRDIVLFLDGREMAGLQPESGAPDLQSNPSQQSTANTGTRPPSIGLLRYHLQRVHGDSERDADNSEHWADLLGLKLDDSRGWERPVEISVGLTGDFPVRTQVTTDSANDNPQTKFSLVRARANWLMFAIFILVAVVVLLIWLGIKSDLLRTRHIVRIHERRPFSLSSVQAAWWFAIIFLSFIFIWLVTGQHDFSSTALILLGIGLGAALGGKVIDVNKQSSTGVDADGALKLTTLRNRKSHLEAEILRAERTGPVDIAKHRSKIAEHDALIQEIQTQFPNAVGPAHRDFLTDILSDEVGVSFHRFQLFVWTIILGLFFVISALGRLAMPVFSDTLLALMGISAGAYLGFKIPESTGPSTPSSPSTVPVADAISIEPSAGSVAGKQEVRITVPGFAAVTTVLFGDVPAVAFTYTSPIVTATTPTCPAGEVVVTVTDEKGISVQGKYEFIEP